jgi:hypothetical protein
MTQQQQKIEKKFIGWKLRLSFYWQISLESEIENFEKILRRNGVWRGF